LIPVMEPIGNVSKAEEFRFWLTFLLEDLPPEASFHPGLLHITLIPWFVSDMEDQAVIDVFKQRFSAEKKFKVRLGPQAKFGPKLNVGVTLIEPSFSLDRLHQRSLRFMEEAQGRWAVKRPHVDEQYIPHIRRRRGTKLPANGSIELTSLSLIKARRQEDNIRQVAAKVELK
jgi:2'-5' RNA ligase